MGMQQLENDDIVPLFSANSRCKACTESANQKGQKRPEQRVRHSFTRCLGGLLRIGEYAGDTSIRVGGRQSRFGADELIEIGAEISTDFSRRESQTYYRKTD